ATIYTSKRLFREDLRGEKPTLLGTVPRIWESILEAVEDQARHRGRVASFIMTKAVALSRAHRRAVRLTRGQPRSPDREATSLERARAAVAAPLLRPFHAIADRLVYRKVRDSTGGCLRLAISGGGSLPWRVEEFFDAAGIVLLNGYGLTETSPVVAVRT